MEQTDVRNVTAIDFQGKCNWLVCDVSFIALAPLIPHLMILANNFLLLIKPQFELEKEDIPPGGVVHDSKMIDKAVKRVTQTFQEHGGKVKKIQASQILGREGNQEVFLFGEYK